MHAAELTFTPARGTHSTFPMSQQQTTTTSSWFATATYTAPAMAPARPAPLLHHPLALHAPASSPGLSAYDDTGSRNVPEYLTRRFVEKATQARMALLKKRLAEGSARLLAAQRGASFSSRPSSTCSSPAPWSRSSSPQAVPAWRPASARPSRATSPSPSSARPRSATPGGTSRRGADLDLFGQRNPLVNDFIQVPVAGTYRHLGKQYDTGEAEAGNGGAHLVLVYLQLLFRFLDSFLLACLALCCRLHHNAGPSAAAGAVVPSVQADLLAQAPTPSTATAAAARRAAAASSLRDGRAGHTSLPCRCRTFPEGSRNVGRRCMGRQRSEHTHPPGGRQPSSHSCLLASARRSHPHQGGWQCI